MGMKMNKEFKRFGGVGVPDKYIAYRCCENGKVKQGVYCTISLPHEVCVAMDFEKGDRVDIGNDGLMIGVILDEGGWKLAGVKNGRLNTKFKRQKGSEMPMTSGVVLIMNWNVVDGMLKFELP